jgi:hypothetical protein
LPAQPGLGWGAIATWCTGLLLGVKLAVSSRAGGCLKRNLMTMVRPVATLLVVSGVYAQVAE